MYIVIYVLGRMQQVAIIVCLHAVAFLARRNYEIPRNPQMRLTGLPNIKQEIDYSSRFPSEVFRKFSTL
jgi:hypothetical protein